MQRPLLVAATLCALVTAIPLARGFAAFGREAEELAEVADAADERPMVMGLIFETGSEIVHHPVYLHAAAHVARMRGGATNFSFALTPHSPLKYRGEPPPTFASEWRPDEFRYALQGHAYDHFLVRGRDPRWLLGRRIGDELEIAAHEGPFWLVKRTGSSAPTPRPPEAKIR